MRLAATTRTFGLTALAIGIGVSSLMAAVPAAPAQAAALGSVSQQGDAPASPLTPYQARLAQIDLLVQAGDCSAVRSEIRGLLNTSPESLYRSDITLSQLREFRNQMDETLFRARNCY